MSEKTVTLPDPDSKGVYKKGRITVAPAGDVNGLLAYPMEEAWSVSVDGKMLMNPDPVGWMPQLYDAPEGAWAAGEEEEKKTR